MNHRTNERTNDIRLFNLVDETSCIVCCRCRVCLCIYTNLYNSKCVHRTICRAFSSELKKKRMEMQLYVVRVANTQRMKRTNNNEKKITFGQIERERETQPIYSQVG